MRHSIQPSFWRDNRPQDGGVAVRQKQKHFARPAKVHGQFLTPAEVANFMVRILSSKGKPVAGVDPACGDGVFLKALVEAGFKEVVGIDLDPEILSRLSPEVEKRARIIDRDGLEPLPFLDGSFNVVVGNPPFSAKYGRVKSQGTLSRFALGKGRRSQAIEALFLERFLQLASPEGVIGVILPEGIFSALPLECVRTFVLERAMVLGIVSLPRGIFSNGTTSKTSILFAQKGKGEAKAFMGVARQLSDLPALLEAYTNHLELETPPAFWVDLSSHSFEPEFYRTNKVTGLSFKPGIPALPLAELISDMRCGGTEYGEKRKFAKEGIPFISAKTITPLGIDFNKDKKFVEPNSLMDKKQAHVIREDVLFVRVGVGCSGRAATVVDSSDVGIADDWIYILRPKSISSFYLALFFYTRPGKTQVDRLKHGVGTVNIPQTLLRQVLIPVPPESFQQYIGTEYGEMVNLRKAGDVAQAKEKFEQMKNAIEAIISDDAPPGVDNG